MERAEKREFVTEMHEALKGSGAVVVSHYAGLTVSDMTELRSAMREAGGTIKVAKNRLTKLALEGTESAHIADLLTGPTVLAFSDDPVAAPKAVVDFSKKNDKLVVLGGAMGATNLDADGVKALASMPSLDELRGKLVGLVQAPAGKIARVVQAPAGQLARVFGAYGNKDAA